MSLLMYAAEIPSIFSKATRALSLVSPHPKPDAANLNIEVGIGSSSSVKDVRVKFLAFSAEATLSSSKL